MPPPQSPPLKHSSPPGNVANRAALIAFPVLFYTSGLIFFLMRIQTRYSMRALAIDDLLMTIAVVFATGFFATTFVTYWAGLGQHITEVDPSRLTAFTKSGMLALPQLFGVAIAALKLSIGFMLLRIKGDRRAWRWFLYALMALVVAVFVINLTITFMVCRPLSVLWTHKVAHAKCLSAQFNRDWYTFFNAVYFVTDISYAVLPAFFIRKLHQPLRDRVVLGLLMALGALCTATNIPRTILVLKQDPTNRDITYNASGTVFWCAVELYLAINAACIPALRHKFEAGLRALGFSLMSGSAPSSHWYRHGKQGYAHQHEMLQKGAASGAASGGSASPSAEPSAPTPVATSAGGKVHSANRSFASDDSVDEPKGDVSWLDVETQRGPPGTNAGILKTDTVDVRSEKPSR